MSDPYAADAPFYDIVHAAHDEDVGLWLSYAGRTQRPVLEVGAGTGRISLALARSGHDVVGIDPSPAMLATARRRGEDDALSVEFREGTATTLVLEPGHYGFVVLPADVFLYCEDGEDQLATLRAIGEALHFSGQLAIDLPGPALWLDPTANGQPLLVFAGELEDGTRLDVWHVHEDDLALQSRILRVSYEETYRDGAVRRRQSVHQLRYPYRFEIEYLLHIAGLSLLGVYGDYDLGPLTNESERMIVVARSMDG